MTEGETIALLIISAVILSAIIFKLVCILEKRRKTGKLMTMGTAVIREVKNAKKEQTTAAELIGGMAVTWENKEVLGTKESMALILKTCEYMIHLDLDRQFFEMLLDKAMLGEISLEAMHTSEKEVKELITWIEEAIFLEECRTG